MPSELQLTKLKCVQMCQYNVDRFLWNSISSYWFVFLSDQTGSSCGSVSIKVNKTRKHFFQKHSWHAHVSPMFRSFLYGKHCFQCPLFVSLDADYTYATRQGILTKIRACEHLQKFCEHDQASSHLIFASNSSKGKILRALSNWMGPFYTHSE